MTTLEGAIEDNYDFEVSELDYEKITVYLETQLREAVNEIDRLSQLRLET